jgi:hypothetical protein
MVMSPVPVLIGLTRPEHLDSTVESRVCVNCDIKVVIDTPVFEADSPLRLRVLTEQLNFQDAQTALLQSWRGAPGFPHEVFSLSAQKFIAGYLQVYAGTCASSTDLLANLDRFPEYVLGSQVFAQLSRMEDLTPERKEEFLGWFTRVFIRDKSLSYKPSITVDDPDDAATEKEGDSEPVSRSAPPRPDDKGRRKGWGANLFVKSPVDEPAPAPGDPVETGKPAKKRFWHRSKPSGA